MGFGPTAAVLSTDQIPSRAVLPVHRGNAPKMVALPPDTIHISSPARGGFITQP